MERVPSKPSYNKQSLGAREIAGGGDGMGEPIDAPEVVEEALELGSESGDNGSGRDDIVDSDSVRRTGPRK